ncbi:hypothetical protein Tco_0665400 [Tanacetum coccineum]
MDAVQPLHSYFAKLKNIDGKVLRKDGKPMKVFHNVHFAADANTPVPFNDFPMHSATESLSENDFIIGSTSKVSTLEDVQDEPAHKDNTSDVPTDHDVPSNMINDNASFKVVQGEQDNFVNGDVHVAKEDSGNASLKAAQDIGTSLNEAPKSFAYVMKITSTKKVVKLVSLTNNDAVQGAHLTLPLAAAKEIGLSLLTTQLGKPIMLDVYTSNMCVNGWGRNSYARALIEVLAEKDLMDYIVMAIPIDDGEGHTLETLEVPIGTNSGLNSASFVLNNSFDDLGDGNTTDDNLNVAKTDSGGFGYDSDSEEVENIIMEQPRFKGGSRNLLGWNPSDVDLSVISQDAQVMHTRIWFKADKKELFCSFIYAHNRYTHHRTLWNNLGMHKLCVRDMPWCFLGDCDVALYLEDHNTGSSNIDISMREFKDCVDEL